uniref:hypothetical protein n=1 Tax=uncultured Pseudoxanthomonas sp. TaxID=281701 RepID=UPI00259A7587
KHPTPALPFACGEREGAEHLLDAFELEEVLIRPPQGLDLGGRAAGQGWRTEPRSHARPGQGWLVK